MGDCGIVFCDLCDGIFLSAEDLSKHQKEEHPVSTKKPKIGPASRVKRPRTPSPEEEKKEGTKEEDEAGSRSKSTASEKGDDGEVKTKKKPKMGPASRVKRSPSRDKVEESKDINDDRAEKDVKEEKDTGISVTKADVSKEGKEGETKVKSESKPKDATGNLLPPKPKIGPASVVKKARSPDFDDREKKYDKKEVKIDKEYEKKKDIELYKEKEIIKDKEKKQEKRNTFSGVSSSFLDSVRKSLLNDSDLSSSDGEARPAEKESKEAKPLKIKKKKRSSVDTDDFLASDGDDATREDKKRKKKKLKDLINGLSPKSARKPKKEDGGGGGDSDQETTSTPKKKPVVPGKRTEGLVLEHDNLDGPQCFKCGTTCKDASNLKNHVLSHYYQVFYTVLPDRKPYICPYPGCELPPIRDRISLTRHYAFSHRKIFEMTDVTPENISCSGRRSGGGRPPGSVRKKVEGGESKPKKVKTATSGGGGVGGGSVSKQLSRAFLDSNDEDSDDGGVRAPLKMPEPVKPDVNGISSSGGSKPDGMEKVKEKKKKEGDLKKMKKKHKKKDKERGKDKDGKEHKHKKKDKDKDKERSEKHKKDRSKDVNPLHRLMAVVSDSSSSSMDSRPVAVGPAWDPEEGGTKKGVYYDLNEDRPAGEPWKMPGIKALSKPSPDADLPSTSEKYEKGQASSPRSSRPESPYIPSTSKNENKEGSGGAPADGDANDDSDSDLDSLMPVFAV